jgi:signal transduction histidine kinase
MNEDRSPPGPTTRFLPAERASPEALASQVALAAAHPLVDALLRTLSGAVAVLNEQRQVVAVNGAYLEAMGIDDAAAVMGLRPGESLGCLESDELPGGCGTAAACKECGAAVAIVAAAARQQPEERDCVVSVERDGIRLDLDLRVRAAPIELDGQRLTVVTLSDVSAERRRSALERVFFHDLTNLVAGLSGACAALDDPDPAEARSAVEDLRLLTARLAREVQLQRALASDRTGSLRLNVERVRVAGLVEQLRRAFQANRTAAGKALQVTDLPDGLELDTDGFLLQRLVAQMLTNAFEATPAGGEVRLSIDGTPDEVVFRAWNAGAIPAGLASRIFQRYFSTKPGEGRGQGTYALKLLGEAYLKGKVGFTSTPEAGTTFELRLPRSIGTPVPPWARGGAPA